MAGLEAGGIKAGRRAGKAGAGKARGEGGKAGGVAAWRQEAGGRSALGLRHAQARLSAVLNLVPPPFPVEVAFPAELGSASRWPRHCMRW